MDTSKNIRVYGIVPDSIVDGPGLRYAVFVQGCTHGCPGCHNPESQPCQGGTLTSTDAILAEIRANGLVHDVTLSGGEPFEQAAACAHLARELKALGYGVWSYTGYLYEDLKRIAESSAPAEGRALALDPAAVGELLAHVDVLVDGPFVSSLKSLGLKWRGSSNQRLIDLAAMRRAGNLNEVILWEPPAYVPEKPASW